MQSASLISKGQHIHLGEEVEEEGCASLHHQSKLANTVRGEAVTKLLS